MDIKKIIENKKEELKKEEMEKIKFNEDKEIQYIISSKNPEYNILTFIKNFEGVKNIQEIVEKKCYIFELKSEDELNLIKRVFDDYSREICEKIKIKRNTKENSIYMDNPYISEYNNYFSFDDLKKNMNKDYDEICIKEQDCFFKIAQRKEVGKNEIIAKYVKAANLIFDNITQEKALKFITTISNLIEKFSKENKTIGSGSNITTENIIPKSLIAENRLKEFRISMKFREVIDIINNENEKSLKKFNGKLISYILKEAKLEAGINSFHCEDLNLWKEAYYSNDNDTQVKLENNLRQKMKSLEIPSAQSIIGINPFEFFNYYNINEKSSSIESSFVSEVVYTLYSLAISEYREKVYSFFDMIINKGEKPKSVEDVINNFNLDKLTVNNFIEYEPNFQKKINKLKNKM